MAQNNADWQDTCTCLYGTRTHSPALSALQKKAQVTELWGGNQTVFGEQEAEWTFSFTTCCRPVQSGWLTRKPSYTARSGSPIKSCSTGLNHWQRGFVWQAWKEATGSESTWRLPSPR